jgi:fluoroquinolone transport system ATP-binding protein
MDDGSIRKSTFSLDGLGNNNEFMDIIKKRQILTLHSRESTLDDIFIKVTGVDTSV